jgi:hypothetical protein
MSKHSLRWILLGFIIALPALACSVLAGGSAPTSLPAATDTSEVVPSATQGQGELNQSAPIQQGSSGYDSEFPLPSDVKDFQKLGAGQINYQTGMSLGDVLDFYRQAFTDQGLTERTLLTVVSETTFSVVFDGSANGKMLVVQAVVLDPSSVNVNVRYE